MPRKKEEGPTKESLVKYQIYHCIPSVELAVHCEDWMRVEHGHTVKAMEAIEFTDGKYIDQVWRALVVGTHEYLSDDNTPKHITTTHTFSGYTEREQSPMTISYGTYRSTEDNSKHIQQIIFYQREGSKTHEYRQARKFIVAAANELLEAFDKPALNLRNLEELTKPE